MPVTATTPVDSRLAIVVAAATAIEQPDVLTSVEHVEAEPRSRGGQAVRIDGAHDQRARPMQQGGNLAFDH